MNAFIVVWKLKVLDCLWNTICPDRHCLTVQIFPTLNRDIFMIVWILPCFAWFVKLSPPAKDSSIRTKLHHRDPQIPSNLVGGKIGASIIPQELNSTSLVRLAFSWAWQHWSWCFVLSLELFRPSLFIYFPAFSSTSVTWCSICFSIAGLHKYPLVDEHLFLIHCSDS